MRQLRAACAALLFIGTAQAAELTRTAQAQAKLDKWLAGRVAVETRNCVPMHATESPIGIDLAFQVSGVFMALLFVTLPFVVRTVQPVLIGLDREVEEAAASLGASRFTTFRRIILPAILPAIAGGAALAFARAMGEYGSVVFVSGNMPYKTEIAPILIVARLEEFAYSEATAIAVVLLVVSFVMLVLINLLERRSMRHER